MPPRFGQADAWTNRPKPVEAWATVFPELPDWIADQRANHVGPEKMRRKLRRDFGIEVTRSTATYWWMSAPKAPESRPLDPDGIAAMRKERDEARQIADEQHEWVLYLVASLQHLKYEPSKVVDFDEAMVDYDNRSWKVPK